LDSTQKEENSLKVSLECSLNSIHGAPSKAHQNQKKPEEELRERIR